MMAMDRRLVSRIALAMALGPFGGPACGGGETTGDQGGDGDGDGEIGVCKKACEAPEDCCNVLPGCLESPYNNYACVEGICDFLGCTDDDMCDEEQTCHPIGGAGMCGTVCTDDDECFEFDTCSYETDDDVMLCGEPDPIPVCPEQLRCEGMGMCDEDSGKCYCTADEQCENEGEVCVPA